MTLRPRLQLALASLLVSVALGLILTPGTAAAGAGETVTTELQPGWNLAGWTEEAAAVSAIFEAIPQLEAVYWWDAFGHQYTWAFRGESGPTGTLATLTPGMGLSLYVGGAETVEWTRPLIPQTGAVTLRPGWNLVTWAGDEGAAPEDAFEPLGDIVVESQGVDTSPLATLTTGSAFWLQVSELREWWQRNSPPIVIFKRGLADYEKAGLQRDVDSVVGYFGRELGVGVSDLRIRFGHDRVECGGYLARTVYLNDRCFASLAHEYVHALQDELKRRNERADDEPAWLTEGTAEYWSDQYHAWRSYSSYENHLRNSVTRRAREATAPLARLWNYNQLLAQTNGYALAQLAVDWLVNHAGEEALFTYYAQPSQSAWTSRFKSAFGLSPGKFFEEFETYRAEVAPPIYRISGNFVDSSGQPLRGIGVAIHSPDGEREASAGGLYGPASFEVEVAEGSYHLSLSVGRCHLGWYGPNGRIVRTQEDAGLVSSSIRGTDLAIRLPRLCSSIHGTIHDPRHSSTAGIEVEAFSEASGRSMATALTDERGDFVLDVRNGTYLLSLSRDGQPLGWDAGVRLTLDRAEARRHVVDDQDVAQVHRVTNLVVILNLPPPPGPPQGQLQGTVRDQSGSPVEGFQVAAYSLDGETFAFGTSDATGAFAFEAPEGTYVFAVGALGCRLGWHHSDDGMVASQDDATRVQARGGRTTTVKIRLRDPSWEPECGE